MVSADRCRHAPQAPFRGMVLAGYLDEDTLVSGCPNCGAYYNARRCAALTRVQKRCGNAAARAGDFCVVHRGLDGAVAS